MTAPAKSRTGVVVALVVALVVAVGGLAYLLLRPKDDASGPGESLPTAAAPVSTSAGPSTAAPSGTTVTHRSGAFSVVLPANGWQTDTTQTSKIAPGAPVIRFAPDLVVYSKGAGQAIGFAIVDLTGTSNAPEAYVANAKTSNFTGCVWSAPKVFTYKDFTGTFVERKACTTPASDGSKVDFDGIQLGVTRADGTKVGMVIRDAPGQTSTRLLALGVLESIRHL